jgi:hypothetical protein
VAELNVVVVVNVDDMATIIGAIDAVVGITPEGEPKEQLKAARDRVSQAVLRACRMRDGIK